MTGRLVAVVGPSGAGKDSLLSAARAALLTDPRFVFVRRAITRPAEAQVHAGAEAHIPLSKSAFLEARDGGGFALHWQAHGLYYGIPRSIDQEIAQGRMVVANLSRAALAGVPSAYRLCVMLISAPPALLSERIAGRGRESPAEVALRLKREASLPPGLDLREIRNDATLEEGAARLLQALRGLAAERST